MAGSKLDTNAVIQHNHHHARMLVIDRAAYDARMRGIHA